MGSCDRVSVVPCTVCSVSFCDCGKWWLLNFSQWTRRLSRSSFRGVVNKSWSGTPGFHAVAARVSNLVQHTGPHGDVTAAITRHICSSR